MANPQKENGYTQIANEVLEKLCETPISGGELKIVLCVIRHTWGFHKKTDKISISQLVTKTKLCRKQVCENLNKLVTKKLLLKDDKALINEYQFNKNYDDWLVTKRELGSYEKVTKVVTKTTPKVVTKKLPTKESKDIITKETTTNVVEGKPSNELQELVDYAKTLNFPLQGSQRLNRYNASNFLKKHGLDKSKKSVEYAVAIRGKPYAPQINDFIQLYRKIGDLINYYERNKNDKRGYRV